DADVLEHVLLADLARILQALALDPFREQGSGRLRDGAAAAVEANVLDLPLSDPELDADHVTAERVVLLVRERRRFQPSVVPRVLVVVEDVLAVELLVLDTHHAKILWASRMPSIIASISSRFV